MRNKQGTKGAVRFLLAQWVVMIVFSTLTWSFLSLHAGYSVFWGGLVSALPNAYFAETLFRYHGAQAAAHIVKCFYQGEAMKLLMTGALFAATFQYLNVVPLAFMMGFIVVQMVFWFAPLFFNNKQKQVKQ